MADNNPSAWPPAPPEGKPETAMKPANALAGWISLVMAVIAALAALFSITSSFPYDESEMQVFLFCMALWLAIAATFGLLGWRSWKSWVALAIIALIVLFFVRVLALNLWSDRLALGYAWGWSGSHWPV